MLFQIVSFIIICTISFFIYSPYSTSDFITDYYFDLTIHNTYNVYIETQDQYGKWKKFINVYNECKNHICTIRLYNMRQKYRLCDQYDQCQLLPEFHPLQIQNIHMAYDRFENNTINTNGIRIYYTVSNKSYVPLVKLEYFHQNGSVVIMNNIEKIWTYSINDLCSIGEDEGYSPGYTSFFKLNYSSENYSPIYYRLSIYINKTLHYIDKWREINLFSNSSNMGFIVIADQGVSSLPVKWPMPGANNVSKSISNYIHKMKNNNVNFKSIFHSGDLSYATGHLFIWDHWLSMIQDLYSSFIPFEVGVGNHEIVDPIGSSFHPSWGNYHSDSGGECGIPTYNYFPHLLKNNQLDWGRRRDSAEPWFNLQFDNGVNCVEFIQLSSEHSFLKNSDQWTWLKSILSISTECFRVVLSHRPMYLSEKGSDADEIVGLHLAEEIEELLYIGKVRLFIAGHTHSYQRTCPILVGECHDHGIIHVTIGTGGYEISNVEYRHETWSEKTIIGNYGFGSILFSDNKFLWSFINQNGEVMDQIEILKRKVNMTEELLNIPDFKKHPLYPDLSEYTKWQVGPPTHQQNHQESVYCSKGLIAGSPSMISLNINLEFLKISGYTLGDYFNCDYIEIERESKYNKEFLILKNEFKSCPHLSIFNEQFRVDLKFIKYGNDYIEMTVGDYDSLYFSPDYCDILNI